MNRAAAGLVFDVVVVLVALGACVLFGAPWSTWTTITATVIGARIASQKGGGGGDDDPHDGSPRGVPRLGAPAQHPSDFPTHSGVAALGAGFVRLVSRTPRRVARSTR